MQPSLLARRPSLPRSSAADVALPGLGLTCGGAGDIGDEPVEKGIVDNLPGLIAALELPAAKPDPS
jgi:hypothetical protein